MICWMQGLSHGNYWVFGFPFFSKCINGSRLGESSHTVREPELLEKCRVQSTKVLPVIMTLNIIGPVLILEDMGSWKMPCTHLLSGVCFSSESSNN